MASDYTGTVAGDRHYSTGTIKRDHYHCSRRRFGRVKVSPWPYYTGFSAGGGPSRRSVKAVKPPSPIAYVFTLTYYYTGFSEGSGQSKGSNRILLLLYWKDICSLARAKTPQDTARHTSTYLAGGTNTHVVRELQLVGQQLPSVAAGLVDHSREHLAPEVEGAVVAEVLGGPRGKKKERATHRQQTNKTNRRNETNQSSGNGIFKGLVYTTNRYQVSYIHVGGC